MKILPYIALMLLAACVQRPIHQGNELSKDKVWMIQTGDSKFQVENAWGSPALIDPLHPNRVEYIQQVQDEDKKEHFVRGVIVEYDQALRVTSIHRFGFKE